MRVRVERKSVFSRLGNGGSCTGDGDKFRHPQDQQWGFNNKWCSFLFFNFSDWWEVKNMWDKFRTYGQLVEIYMEFLTYKNISDVPNMEKKINDTWVGSYRVRGFVSNNGSQRRSEPVKINTRTANVSSCHDLKWSLQGFVLVVFVMIARVYTRWGEVVIVIGLEWVRIWQVMVVAGGVGTNDPSTYIVLLQRSSLYPALLVPGDSKEWNSGDDQLRFRWMIYLVVLADAAERVRDAIRFEYCLASSCDGQCECMIHTSKGYNEGMLLSIFGLATPWKGVVRFGKKDKLAPRYVRPFEILERIGLVAYRVILFSVQSDPNWDSFEVRFLFGIVAHVMSGWKSQDGSADGPTVVNDKDNKQDSVIEVKENIQEEATGCTMVVNDHDGTQEKVPGDDVIVEKKDQEDTQIAATTSQMSTSSSGSKESARNLKGRVE
ncbi:hypothetical protein Tco_0270891 [Tanacetum coccineum]